MCCSGPTDRPDRRTRQLGGSDMEVRLLRGTAARIPQLRGKGLRHALSDVRHLDAVVLVDDRMLIRAEHGVDTRAARDAKLGGGGGGGRAAAAEDLDGVVLDVDLEVARLAHHPQPAQPVATALLDLDHRHGVGVAAISPLAVERRLVDLRAAEVRDAAGAQADLRHLHGIRERQDALLLVQGRSRVVVGAHHQRALQASCSLRWQPSMPPKGSRLGRSHRVHGEHVA
mmetsp:Transcript_60077/g.194837  ORF Transcript_60077/g.194837 Transcript_60077/m.194837 type:complete len:228 (-) Transcript_60077:358-1041(-)